MGVGTGTFGTAPIGNLFIYCAQPSLDINFHSEFQLNQYLKKANFTLMDIPEGYKV